MRVSNNQFPVTSYQFPVTSFQFFTINLATGN